jgi:hypothetical protein
LRPFFLETSALVKAVVPEPGSRLVKHIIGLRGQGGEVKTSRIALFEAANVLKRRWLSALKAPNTDRKKAEATEEYRNGTLTLLATIPHDVTIVDELAEDNFIQVLIAVGEVPDDGTLDVVDVMHARYFTELLLRTAGGQSEPYMVSADEALNVYCRAHGIAVINPIEEEKHLP